MAKRPKVIVPARKVDLREVIVPIVKTNSEVIFDHYLESNKKGKIFETEDEYFGIFKDVILVSKKAEEADKKVEILQAEKVQLYPESPRVEMNVEALKKWAEKHDLTIWETEQFFFVLGPVVIMAKIGREKV